MLPSMPLISTHYKEGQNETVIPPEAGSADPTQQTTKALDLSITSKKSSPLKHVTPILRKYNCHRKGKGGKISLSNEQPQSPDKQSFRPIVPKPIMMVLSPTVDDKAPQKEGNESSEAVKQETSETSESRKGEEGKKEERKDNEEELAALMLASTTVRTNKGRPTNVRKKPKQIRDMETAVTLLSPEDPAVREEKSFGFAQAYFLKVKERLEGTVLYHEFLHTMNEFGTSIIEVTDLYKKITSILSPHPDLCEEFLAFLLPEQAMQCGKLMEYLMITQMREFFRRLEVCFEKQPQQMLKFYSALTALSGQSNVTIEDVRGAILPLLKGNAFLMESFLNLLPEEKPPESMMTEFEEMDFGDKDYDRFKEEDLYENLVVPKQPDAFGGDGCACTCHNSRDDNYRNKTAHCLSCGTRFINGKVFVHSGKVLRPAKVVFETESSKDSISRLSSKNRRRVRNRKRTITPYSNSPVKQGRFIFGGSVSPKNSRASKSKVSQKPRSSKTCHNLVKPKASSTSRSNKQNSVRSSSKSGRGGQSRRPPGSCNTNVMSDVNTKITATCTSVTVTSVQLTQTRQGAIVHDESAIIPSVLGTATARVKDLGTFSHELNSAQEDLRSEVVSQTTEQEDAILPETVGTTDLNINNFSSLSQILQNSHEENRDKVLDQEQSVVPVVLVKSEPDVDCILSLVQPVHDTQEDSNTSQPNCEEMDIISSKECSILSDPNVATQSERDFSSFSGNLKKSPDEISYEDMREEAMDQDAIQDNSLMKEEIVAQIESEPMLSLDVEVSNPKAKLSKTSQEVSKEQIIESMDECFLESDRINSCLDSCVSPYVQGISDSEGKAEGKSGSAWTREEDKVILEMYKQEHSFLEISEQLPQRSVEEVKCRFEILINILKQMTVGKMDEDSNSTPP